MGDIAEEHLQRMLDGPRWPYPNYRPPPTCRTCAALCYWGQRRGAWTLMENGQPHICRADDIERKALDGFEAID